MRNCSLLTCKMVIVTALVKPLNTQTGHMEEQPILSVAIPRKTLNQLNFETLDPSDSMNNFIHKMNFKRTAGFSSGERIKPSDIQHVK